MMVVMSVNLLVATVVLETKARPELPTQSHFAALQDDAAASPVMFADPVPFAAKVGIPPESVPYEVVYVTVDVISTVMYEVVLEDVAVALSAVSPVDVVPTAMDEVDAEDEAVVVTAVLLVDVLSDVIYEDGTEDVVAALTVLSLVEVRSTVLYELDLEDVVVALTVELPYSRALSTPW